VPGTNLTRDEATTRSDLVTVDSYVVELDLTTDEATFATTSTITFTADLEAGSDDGSAQTFVDFIGQSVEEIVLNGDSLDPATHFADSRITLPGLAAENTVTIRATGLYTNTGEGLHRFVDPVDDEVYLYSQFEVPDSRRMYPVFEQPDLKGTFQFTVTAPAHWKVISNAPDPEPEVLEGGAGDDGAVTPKAVWRFAPTQRISSYITALVAGPYDVVRDSLTSRGGEVPLGIYCRKSLSPYLDADNLFEITKQGFAFFEEEFDCAYPFEKYDQLFTPEYNMGAMENAGCVTFNEVYVFRSRVPDALVERRALTVLHELAHMWFGNLVTMKWWNDLWLNESFAEWASTTCQAEATQWTDAWTTFSSMEKDWAYREDQLSTTHPIVAEIRDLRDVEVNFDGITYAKGASVLKQLVAYVGREPFREGLRAYFRKHAWGNTRLSDLLDELEATSGRDLRAWSAAWLETAGVNTLRSHIDTDDDGVITSAVIEQTAPQDHPTIRPHRLAIGLYALSQDGEDTTLERVDRVEIDVDGARTEVPELVGNAQPDFLLVNDDDLAYAKLRLDQRSVETGLAYPRAFSSSLPRALFLGSAWDMTRDAELGARSFIDLVLATIPGESDSTLLRTLLQQLQTALFFYVDPAQRESTRTRVRETLWELARGAEAGSDAQLQLVMATANVTGPGDDVSAFAGLLDGTQEQDGLVVDFEMRWTLLTALAAAGTAGADEIRAEREREDTSSARERAAKALAARPTAQAKEEAWQAAVVESGLPNAMVAATGIGFSRPGGNAELLGPFIARYHDMLATVEEKGSHAILEAVVEGFYPRVLASQELLDASNAWLAANTDAEQSLRRLVTENRDPIERALRAQVRDAEDS